MAQANIDERGLRGPGLISMQRGGGFHVIIFFYNFLRSICLQPHGGAAGAGTGSGVVQPM